MPHRGARGGRERARNWKSILKKKTVKENFPNSVKEIDMQVQEVQRVPIMMDARSLTPKHTIIKRPKVKDKEILLKAAREK